MMTDEKFTFRSIREDIPGYDLLEVTFGVPSICPIPRQLLPKFVLFFFFKQQKTLGRPKSQQFPISTRVKKRRVWRLPTKKIPGNWRYMRLGC